MNNFSLEKTGFILTRLMVQLYLDASQPSAGSVCTFYPFFHTTFKMQLLLHTLGNLNVWFIQYWLFFFVTFLPFITIINFNNKYLYFLLKKDFSYFNSTVLLEICFNIFYLKTIFYILSHHPANISSSFAPTSFYYFELLATILQASCYF